VVILAKTSVISCVLATKAIIEAQLPILKSSAARLTAIQMSGVVMASVLALFLVRGLFSGKDEPKQVITEDQTSAMMERVESLGIGQV
jgi:hypothetical protein